MRIINSERDWQKVVKELLPKIKKGSTILLFGPLGAGKTTFVKELVSALGGSKNEVNSPTFTIVQSYKTPAGEVLHLDGYRLESPDREIEEYISEEIKGEQKIIAVEWPERFKISWPSESLILKMEIYGQKRALLTD